MTHQNFDYALNESPGDEVRLLLGQVPSRWGRMPPICRALIVEAALFLRHNDLLSDGMKFSEQGQTIGLIGGSRFGSLTTDLAFAETMKSNPAFASPALFGYTLANIPVAEVANQFGLTGPVYTVIDSKTPLDSARREARSLITHMKNIDFMLACAFDAYYRESDNEQLIATFTLIERHAENHTDLPQVE